MILAFWKSSSRVLRGLGIAFLWLVLISVLHWTFNVERHNSNVVRMGYMPVITNLAAPIIDFVSKGTDVYFEAIKFASFAEMAESFRTKHIDVAFIIAPLAIEMYRQGIPLKVVYIGNRHESTLIVRKDSQAKNLSDLAGKTIAVPIRYSGHLLAIQRDLRAHGLTSDAVRTLEIQPPDMPSALAAGGIDGYFVGEPFASTARFTGIGTKLLDVEEIWPHFICNLMIVQDDLIRSNPQWVQTLVTAAVRSGFWAENHIEEVTQLISKYWNQNPELVRYTFTHPPKRFRFDLYAPSVGELETIAHEMHRSGLLNESKIDLQRMVENRFAKNVNPSPVASLRDILPR